MSLFVKAFITLFVIVDPIALAPIFISLTAKYSEEEQGQIARRAVIIAGVILVVFTLIGKWLFEYLGISIQAFQVAAGILLFRIAMDMVFIQPERETEEEEKEAELRDDVSIFPLAIPLVAGPGALSSILILVSETDNYPLGVSMILLVAFIVLAITYLFFRLAKPLAGILGQTGVNVITRVLGVLLAALAVQYISNGAIVLLQQAFPIS